MTGFILKIGIIGIVSAIVSSDFLPTTSVQLLNATFLDMFSEPRHDLEQKHVVRQKILQKLNEFGLRTFFHEFIPRKGKLGGVATGVNVIGVRERDIKEDQEEILIFAAHYDTSGDRRNYFDQALAPGVVDNGSGSTAIFEIARLLSEYDCKLRKTIYFVFMDLEEYGALGSESFVSEIAIPKLLRQEKKQILGAYVLDMVLVYEDENGTQNITSDMIRFLPEWTAEIERQGYRGNYLAVRGRRNHDDYLFHKLNQSWIGQSSIANSSEETKYKLYKVDPVMPKYFEGNRSSDMYSEIYYNPFSASDHRNFWYGHRSVPGNPKITIPAVALCDMANYKYSYMKCYHNPCDDKSRLTEKNLNFMRHTVNALIRTALDICEGECNANRRRDSSYIWLLAAIVLFLTVCAALIGFAYYMRGRQQVTVRNGNNNNTVMNALLTNKSTEMQSST